MESLFSSLRRAPFTGWDLLDIAIVALVIYELLILIRGTRAVQMALGFSFLVGLYYLSQWVGLQTVNWLIRNLAGYVVFGVIVLFQDDIRRALSHFGRAPFFRYFAQFETAEEAVEEIVLASSALAAQRTGAIIVIEGEIGLRNYVEAGIPVDALLTSDLLISVFQLGSPLHDGAVIVQGDRIAAAACFLPLTVNPRLSKALGTRHRAAIGLTEESDALVVVISEETGAISLVYVGDIERSLDTETLRERLRALRLPRRRAAPAPPSHAAASRL
jgi:diadenylate cyclase